MHVLVGWLCVKGEVCMADFEYRGTVVKVGSLVKPSSKGCDCLKSFMS